ncbi:MAG: hypothetical protein WBG43_01150 [Marinifilaceae bacterium]
MKDLLHYSSLKIQYFFRLRKSRGFGIHSPFVFRLVTQVIKDDYPFYVFDLIDKKLEKYTYRDVKYAKIVYRIINELKIKSIYCKSPVFECSKLICEHADSEHIFLSSINQKVDDYKLVYAGDDDLEKLLEKKTIDSLKGTKTIVILNEMYKNNATMEAYNALRAEAQVSLDLFYRALLFFDPKLQKGSYSIKV